MNWRHALLLLFLFLVVVACTRDEDGANTVSDDVLIIYSSIPSDNLETYSAAFEEAYPNINYKIHRESARDLTQRLLEELENPIADVIWGLPIASMIPFEWRELLDPYSPAGLDRISPTFYDTNRPPHWVGMAGRTLVFCVNTEEIERLNIPTPTSWQDLLEPIYQGHIAVPSSITSGSGYNVLATIFQIYGETEAWDYLSMLHKNAVYVNNANAACEFVSTGEIPIGISLAFRGFQQREAGKPVKVIFPIGEVGWDIEVNALVQKMVPNPNAKVFLDWAISDHAMNLYASDRIFVTAPVETLESDSYYTAEEALTILLDQDNPWIAANQERIIREWTDIYGDEATIHE